jgi:hypothetical protein
MQESNCLERPASLQEGKHYYLRLNKQGDGFPVFAQVTLYGYTSCPAVVIVQDGGKGWLRCGRSDLFTSA